VACARIFFCAAGVALSSHCGNYLSKFLEEELALANPAPSLTYVSDTAAQVKIQAKRLIISIVFRANQAGAYRIVNGLDCATGAVSAISAQTGSLAANTNATASVFIEEIVATANSATICFASTNGKTTSLTKTFASSVFTDLATLQNETYGASGAPIDSGITTSFQIFQNVQTAPAWTNATQNRGAGMVVQNGAREPYGLGAYIDVNDSYRLKFVVADRANHRVLIFNQVPDSNASNPDVVVGQPTFATGGSNYSTVATNNRGFDRPYAARVCATGQLVVADRDNNRIAIFNTLPKSNGAAMDLVLGQNDFTNNVQNTGAVTMNARLFQPGDVTCLKGKLYISDTSNHRLVVHNNFPTVTATSADYAIGQPSLAAPGASGFDFVAVPDYLNLPLQIAYSGSQFFLVDSTNHRVLVYNSIPTAGQKPDFIIGQIDSTSRTANQGAANPLQTSLSAPRSMSISGTKLAISDQSNERIMFFNLPITGNAPSATHQVGRASFTDGTSEAVAQATFSGQLPRDILFDGKFIWVADAGNHRVQYLALPF